MGKHTRIAKLVVRLLVPPVILGSMFIVAAFIYISGYGVASNVYESSIVSSVSINSGSPRPELTNLTHVPTKKTAIDDNLNKDILDDHIVYLKNVKLNLTEIDNKRAKRFDSDNINNSEEMELKDEDKSSREIEAIINNKYVRTENNQHIRTENNQDIGRLMNNQFSVVSNKMSTDLDYPINNPYSNPSVINYVYITTSMSPIMVTNPMTYDGNIRLSHNNMETSKAEITEDMKMNVNTDEQPLDNTPVVTDIYTLPEQEGREEQMYLKFLTQGKELSVRKSDKDYNLERERQINENIARQRIEDFFNNNFVKNYMRIQEVTSGTPDSEYEVTEALTFPEITTIKKNVKQDQLTVMNLDDSSLPSVNEAAITESTNIIQNVVITERILNENYTIPEGEEDKNDYYVLQFIRKRTATTLNTIADVEDTTTKHSVVIYTDEDNENVNQTPKPSKKNTLTSTQDQSLNKQNVFHYSENVRKNMEREHQSIDEDRNQTVEEIDSMEVVTFDYPNNNIAEPNIAGYRRGSDNKIGFYRRGSENTVDSGENANRIDDSGSGSRNRIDGPDSDSGSKLDRYDNDRRAIVDNSRKDAANKMDESRSYRGNRKDSTGSDSRNIIDGSENYNENRSHGTGNHNENRIDSFARESENTKDDSVTDRGDNEITKMAYNENDKKSRLIRGNDDYYDSERTSESEDMKSKFGYAESESTPVYVEQTPLFGTTKFDTTKYDTSKYDTPKYDTTKYETSNSETTKFDTTKRANQIDVLDIISPWIAIVFTKDVPSEQFTYACDGALVSARKILIAANCLKNLTTSTDDEDIIVILGKRHQNNMTASDVYTVKQVKYHPRFSIKNGRKMKNNLALIVTEKSIKLEDSRIEVANLLDKQHRDENIVDAVSTGWIETGALHPIHFDVTNLNTKCLKKHEKKLSNVFCSPHEPNAPTCPSHGGLYVVQLQDGSWYLKGILSEITSKLNVCGDRNLRFTDITKYDKWLRSQIK